MGPGDLWNQPTDERRVNRIRKLSPRLRSLGRRSIGCRPIAGRLATPSVAFARRLTARFARAAGIWERASQLLRRVASGAATVLHRHDHRWLVTRLAPHIDVRVDGPRGRRASAERPGEDERTILVIPSRPRLSAAAIASSRIPGGAPAMPRSATAAPRPAAGAPTGGRIEGARAPALPSDRTTQPILRRRRPAAPALMPGEGRDEVSAARDVGRKMAPVRTVRVEEPSWASSRCVVRRPPRAAMAPPAAADWPAPGQSRPDSRAARPTPASAQRASQLDMQRVTDQVMRQIDRRMVAWRERTGRA